jgi:hypothetical protein
MLDAFGNILDLGSKVIAIANTNTSQTFYLGKIVNFTGNFATVQVEEVSLVYGEEYVPKSGDEKRVCPSHRLVKI